MLEPCFRVSTPSVIYEKFDEELVAINLDTGVYHSLAGAAADAFELLAQEATQEEVSAALATKYAAGPDAIHTALTPFFEQLRKEGLIQHVETRKERERDSLHLGGERSGVAFSPPTLEAYRDLQSLFLLDPVHDVGEDGWPEPKPGASEA